jgi:hypothetical protein
MGAIALNGAGQLALAYNSSGTTRNASIGFTGRNDPDPSNLMSYAETDAVIGSDYGTFSNRWGDYSDIQSDVSDDSLFWFTGMYGDSAQKWKTRILSFRLRPNLDLDAKLVSIDEPNNCTGTCSPVVTPKITVRNLGSKTLHNLTVALSVNGGAAVLIPWTGNLNISEQVSITLPATSLPPGSSILQIYLTGPNGGADQNTANDTATTVVNSGAITALPLQEGFEMPLFPPSGWALVGNGSPSFHWNRTTTASHSGQASKYFDNYGTNEPLAFSDLRTPLLDISGGDSAVLSFWGAAAQLSPDHQDTLELLVSTDCGVAYTSLWKKWGDALATRTGYLPNAFTPTAGDWRQETLDLTGLIKGGRISLAFRNRNAYGNNIFVDDINIQKIIRAANDAELYRIEEPGQVICTPSLLPSFRFVNKGSDTLRSLTVGYRLDGGAVQTIKWTGSLARLTGASVTLSATTVNAFGVHTLEAFISSPNGVSDGDPSNDTLRLTFSYQPTADLPQKEGFEPDQFPPAGWFLVNPDGDLTWKRTTKVAREGQASAFMNNFNYADHGQVDALISPLFRFASADSIYFDFQLSAATYSYPGSTDIPMDTLEVLLSTDCGVHFTSVYKKWGADLQTLGDPNAPHPTEFFPSGPQQWRKETVNLTEALAGAPSFILQIRNTNNPENNLFLDELNLYTRNLPASLKQKGYLISPNPFRDHITLRQYPDASGFLGLEIFGATGQLVYKMDHVDGPASASIELDLGKLARGMYVVRLRFKDRLESQRIIKQ